MTALPSAWCAASSSAERGAVEQRDVARHHDDGAVDALAHDLAVGDGRGSRGRLRLGVERGQGALHGAARAGDLVLVYEDRAGVELPDGVRDQVALVPDHHCHLRRLELASGGQRVPHHRLAAERMQDLRQRGLHAGALAGGKNDDCCRLRCLGHECSDR